MDHVSTSQGERVLIKALRFFFLNFIVIGMVCGGLVFLFYNYQVKGFVGDLLVRERHGVEMCRTVVADSLEEVATDLDLIATQRNLAEYVATGDASLLNDIATDFYLFIRAQKAYDQIHLLDSEGMELVRVDYNGGLPDIVPNPLLQNKGKRYYFKDTMQLEKGQMFVSPMDLNIERGKVQVPYKPVIRFGTALYGQGARPVAAILLNYRADVLLGQLRKMGAVTSGQTMLLDHRGYWLLAPDSVDQWGFMFPDKKDVKFGKRYAKPWISLRSKDSGQIVSGDMVFTFSTIYPLRTRFRSSTGAVSAYAPSKGTVQGSQYFWKLVSFVPDTTSQGYTGSLLLKVFFVGALLFLVAGAVAWLIAFSMTRRRLEWSRQMSMDLHDSLTGLPNQALFRDRLEQATKHAAGYGHRLGVLTVAVDDFDSIALTYGAESADELLMHVAVRLKGCMAQGDTSTRMDGGVFSIILAQIDGLDACQSVADSIIEAMGHPFVLSDGSVNISVSIGASLYPVDGDDGGDGDTLLRLSSEAMLGAQAQGANRVRFSTDPVGASAQEGGRGRSSP